MQRAYDVRDGENTYQELDHVAVLFIHIDVHDSEL
jgi:hypothetical protein